MIRNEDIKPVTQSIEEFTTELEGKKIKIWVDGDSLRYKAPMGIVTKEILESLGDRKTEIVNYLKLKSTSGIFSAPIGKVEEKEYYPLSAAQLRMFFLSRQDSNSPANNLTHTLRINGEFDIDHLTEVIKQLVDRHEALRTSFDIVEGEPVQKVHNTVDFNVDFQEIEDSKEAIEQILKDFIKPYDLTKTPLFRFKLVRLINGDKKPAYILIQDMHHIISDGVSSDLLTHEVKELFLGKCLPDLKIQYKDYTDWHQMLLSSNEIQRQKQYWIEKLGTDIPILNLPTDYARPQVFSFKGASVKFTIGKILTDKLCGFARENKVTLFTLLLASYSILISRYTGQDDIIIGTPTTGRQHVDLNNTMGVFANNLVLRVSYSPGCDFNGFLRSLGKEVLQAFDNQDYPFEYLLDDLMIKRDPSRNPIFDTMFILQNTSTDTDEFKVDELEISKYDFDKGIAQFDITLIGIEKKDGIDIEINYCTSLFNEKTISILGERFVNILNYLVEHLETKLSEIEMLSNVEIMELKKVLPMSFPCITSYPTHANMLACVSQYEESIQWFYNYYVQLFTGREYLDQGYYVDFCVPRPWKACPWFSFQKIDRELVKKGWSSAEKFIIDSIDSGYYIFIYLDQFYIPDSSSFKTQHSLHDSFIYGYDRGNKRFNLADFYKYSMYSFSSASFYQVNKAFKENQLFQDSDQLQDIVLVKPVKYDYFKFDVKLLRGFIEDYIQSKSSNKSYTDNYRSDIGDSRDNWAYGLEVYSCFQKHMEFAMQNKVELDIRAFKVFVDHKTLMLSRIKYLSEHQLLTNSDSIYNEYEVIRNEFTSFCNIALKRLISGNLKGIQSLSDKFPKIIAKERNVLEKLLDNL